MTIRQHRVETRSLVSDASTIAIVGAISGGAGALLQYIAARQTSAATIAERRRDSERSEADSRVVFLQAEIARISADRDRIAAERDRFMSQLLADAGLMHEVSATIETALPKGTEAAP